MKGRDMFYSNYQAVGYQDPNIIMTPPQGYNINTQYSAFCPGVYPQNNVPINQMNQNNYQNYADSYDERLTRIERQIQALDQRLRKLEALNNTDNSINDSNLYMI